MKKIFAFFISVSVLLIALWIILPNISNCNVDVQIVDTNSISPFELSKERLMKDFRMSSSKRGSDYQCFALKLKLINNNDFDVCNWRLTSIKINKDVEIYFDHATPEAVSTIIEAGGKREQTYLVYMETSDFSEEYINTLNSAEIKVKAQKAKSYSDN